MRGINNSILGVPRTTGLFVASAFDFFFLINGTANKFVLCLRPLPVVEMTVAEETVQKSLFPHPPPHPHPPQTQTSTTTNLDLFLTKTTRSTAATTTADPYTTKATPDFAPDNA